MSRLLGSTIPLSAKELAQRDATPADSEQQYRDATDWDIEAGDALDEDRDALLAFADPWRLSG